MQNVTLVTSDDYWLAAIVRDELTRRGYSVDILDVKLKTKGDFAKKAKLALLFGPLAILDILAVSAANKKRLADSVRRVTRVEAIEIVKATDSTVMLMNYPKKFPVLDRPVLNFHPARLPYHKGLMSLPRAQLEYLRGGNPPLGVSIHDIAATFDTGPLRWQKSYDESELRLSIRKLYEVGYRSSAEGLDAICTGTAAPLSSEGIPSNYSNVLTWTEVLDLGWRKLIGRLGLGRRASLL